MKTKILSSALLVCSMVISAHAMAMMGHEMDSAEHMEMMKASGTMQAMPAMMKGMDHGSKVTKGREMMDKAKTLSKDLSSGSKGEQVTVLQEILIEKGFLTMPAGAKMGTFGPSTKKAVMMYQKSIGVKPTGYVGSKTRSMLSSMGINMSASSTVMHNSVKPNITDSMMQNKIKMDQMMDFEKMKRASLGSSTTVDR
jgi:murein L,D-transpeptidase YcbB/YkuD